jgi:hypothetical protein
VEFSIILGNGTKPSVRFAFEPSALPLAGDRSITTLRRALEQLAGALKMKPKFDLEWFDICAEELLLSEAQERPVTNLPVSETCLGRMSTFIVIFGTDIFDQVSTVRIILLVPRFTSCPAFDLWFQKRRWRT